MNLQDQNALLMAELGTQPLYQWKHTSELWLSIQKIEQGEGGAIPQYHHAANPHTGLIEVRPVYVKMPMLPMFRDNWVLCRYVQADQESVFKSKVGTMMEYPAGGIWQPLQQTVLRQGIKPKERDTWNMIRAVRANREAVKNHLDNAEEIQDKKHQADKNRFVDMCRDKFSAQMEVPGRKGGTAFFSAPSTEPVQLNKETVQ